MTSLDAVPGNAPLRSPVLGAERRRLTLQLVRSGEAGEVAELARRFRVSQMTVRRDLSQLARQGKLTRVHGGAVSDGEDRPFGVTQVERADAKERVGRAAAALVQDGQTLMIDIGTTTLHLARALHGRELTVITNSLAVVDDLMGEAKIELIVLGGTVRRTYRSVVGMLAEDALRQLSADFAFLGASGIRREDLAVMDTTMVEVPTKRGMLASAARSVLLVDAGKFTMGGTVRVCGSAELDTVITNDGVDTWVVDGMARLGVELVLA